jgi:hypothetical protein
MRQKAGGRNEMDDLQKERALELVEHLESAGMTCGLLVVRGTVVLGCPGAPYNDSPLMTFNETDLHNAAALDLLERKRMVTQTFPAAGSYEWESCVAKRAAGRTKSVVMLATPHLLNRVPANDETLGLEKCLRYLRDRLRPQIVMEEWSEEKGESVAKAFAGESNPALLWRNVGTPDQTQYRTFGCIKHPGYHGALKPYDPEHDPDAPWMEEYGPFENQQNRECRMAENVRAEMERYETGLFVLGRAHLHSVFGKLRCLGFKVVAFSWL